jgi:hypothetical protein
VECPFAIRHDWNPAAERLRGCSLLRWGLYSMGRDISDFGTAGVRRAVYLLAIGFIMLWTAYCLLDLTYVVLSYWALAPGVGILPFFTEPVVEPGFWGDYLKRLTASWGSVVTGAGVVALLLRHHAAPAARRPELDGPVETYPIIPEAERTEPRLLFIEEQRLPRGTEREAVRREPDFQPSEPPLGEAPPAAPPRRPAVREVEPRLERGGGEEERRAPVRTTAPFVRAIRGRSAAAPQPRRLDPEQDEHEGAPEEPRLFSGGAREEYAFFEVEYEDGTGSVERLRRADFGGDEAAGVSMLRRRLAERAAAERRPVKPIATIKPVSYFGFPNRR